MKNTKTSKYPVGSREHRKRVKYDKNKERNRLRKGWRHHKRGSSSDESQNWNVDHQVTTEYLNDINSNGYQELATQHNNANKANNRTLNSNPEDINVKSNETDLIYNYIELKNKLFNNDNPEETESKNDAEESEPQKTDAEKNTLDQDNDSKKRRFRGRRNKLTEEEKRKKKEEKQKRKISARKKKEAERLAKLSPNSFDRYKKKRQIIEERREYKKSLSKSERKAYNEKQKELRKKRKEEIFQAKQQKIKESMKDLSPNSKEKKEKRLEEKIRKKLLKKAEKEKEKERFNGLSPEEKKAEKEKKRKEKMERKMKWAYLNKSWLKKLPDNLDYVIVDGNNLRGGGPKRFSRSEVIAHISAIKESLNQLKKTKIIVMFDKKISKYDPIENVEVQFSGDKIADDVIINMIQKLNNVCKPDQDISSSLGKKILVITCDRLFALRVLGLKQMVMRNKVFTSMVPGFNRRSR